jgi:hypothetical protein
MLKNAIIYNADLPPAGTLVDYMVERPWQDIREDQRSVSRFVPDEEGILVREFPGGYAIMMRTDEKILPPSILTEECDKGLLPPGVAAAVRRSLDGQVSRRLHVGVGAHLPGSEDPNHQHQRYLAGRYRAAPQVH